MRCCSPTGTPPLVYAWDFDGGGTTDSTEPSPAFTCAAPGLYSVRLNVTNPYGSDEEIKTGYINVSLENHDITFSADVCSGSDSLTEQVFATSYDPPDK